MNNLCLFITSCPLVLLVPKLFCNGFIFHISQIRKTSQRKVTCWRKQNKSLVELRELPGCEVPMKPKILSKQKWRDKDNFAVSISKSRCATAQHMLHATVSISIVAPLPHPVPTHKTILHVSPFSGTYGSHDMSAMTMARVFSQTQIKKHFFWDPIIFPVV